MVKQVVLPVELASIYVNKQRSYKMVLIISLISEMRASGEYVVPLGRVRERFLQSFIDREENGQPVDQVPAAMATSWREITNIQLRQIVDTPINALNSIIEVKESEDIISFRQEWGQTVLDELYDISRRELKSYYKEDSTDTFSLHNSLYRILTTYLQAKTEPFSGHELGSFVRREVPKNMRNIPFMDERFKIEGSVGKGNWAKIPWIAIMHKDITDKIQEGEYIVYLFAEDMQTVYLTIAQGVSKPIEEMGRREAYEYLQKKVKEMREIMPLEGMQKDENIHLSNSGLGRDYQVSTVAYYRYDLNDLPDDEKLLSDLRNVVKNYNLYVESINKEESPEMNITVRERIKIIKQYINSKGFVYPDRLIENFYLSLKTKPFVILAGVSGTGKTKLVELFAEALGATEKNGQYKHIPVRPDWSDPADLIGYQDLSGVFRPGPITDVLRDAVQPENRNKPYFICLDEMNLARVEHYFSDLLSVMETQKWEGDVIVTQPLIHKFILERDEDWEKYGDIYFPDNVYLIGTVNMDETTHPFSKKVLDRANTIEFNEINLSLFPMESQALVKAKVMQTDNTFLRSDYLTLLDAINDFRDLIEDTTEVLVRINQILEEVHSHVGFRIRDTISFYIIYNQRFELMSLDEAMDLQIMQKLLPRIQGSSSATKRVLLRLLEVALGHSIGISRHMEDASGLYENVEQLKLARYPRTANKIAFMLRRLEEDGFTSYWLS